MSMAARLREALAIAFGACLVPVLLIVAGVMALSPDED